MFKCFLNIIKFLRSKGTPNKKITIICRLNVNYGMCFQCTYTHIMHLSPRILITIGPISVKSINLTIKANFYKVPSTSFTTKNFFHSYVHYSTLTEFNTRQSYTYFQPFTNRKRDDTDPYSIHNLHDSMGR